MIGHSISHRDELSLKVVGGWMELKVEFEWRIALQVEDRA